MQNKYEIHMDICNDLNALYQRKNHDYGDSFGEFYAEFGLISTCMRLTDKLKRLKSFAKGADMQVKDESLKDTLMDLANYSIMTLVEMEIANTKSIPQQNIIRETDFGSCRTCRHEALLSECHPCDKCWYGNGADITQNFWEPKNEAERSTAQ